MIICNDTGVKRTVFMLDDGDGGERRTAPLAGEATWHLAGWILLWLLSSDPPELLEEVPASVGDLRGGSSRPGWYRLKLLSEVLSSSSRRGCPKSGNGDGAFQSWNATRRMRTK